MINPVRISKRRIILKNVNVRGVNDMWEKIKENAESVIAASFFICLILGLAVAGALSLWQYYLYICQTYGV